MKWALFFCVAAGCFCLGMIAGLTIAEKIQNAYPKRELVPAYDIKHEYATVKVTERIYDFKECKFEKAGEWWEQQGYKAVVSLSEADWHQGKIPEKMSMQFNGLQDGWGVQVDNQWPETDRPACHLYINNKPTHEFHLDLKGSGFYKWEVVFYRTSKDADPNFNKDDVRVDFIWKVNRINKK